MIRTAFIALIVLGGLVLRSTAAELKLEEKGWMNLWEVKAPGALGDGPEDTPAVQVFLPEEGKATGSSIVVCPGGGYSGRAAHEGPVVGEWLAKNGKLPVTRLSNR